MEGVNSHQCFLFLKFFGVYAIKNKELQNDKLK